MSGKKKRTLRPDRVWQEAREIIRRYRHRIALGLVVMAVGRLAGMMIPLSSKVLIDNVIGESRADLLLPLGLAVAAAALVQGSSTFALARILGVTAQRAITEMRKTVQQHVARLPVNYFDSTRSGVLISRIMTDAEGIRNLVGTGLVQLTGGIFTALFSLGFLLYINWSLTTYTIGILIVFGGTMAFAFRRLRPLFRERGRINAEVTGRLGESLAGVRIVKAYTSERKENLIFARGAHRLLRNVARSVTGVSALTAFSSVVMGAIGLLMVQLGGSAVLTGEMSLGDLIMYIFFTGWMISPLVQMASIGTQITDAFAGLDRIREVRALSTEIEDDDARFPLGKVQGHIAFEDVGFSYEEGIPVLRGISLDAPPGSTTALVGSSGSGKSTLISLVLAFNRPDSGRILIDGQDLAELRLGDYRRQVGVVLQDNFLFDDTVDANIRYGRSSATREEVVRAARLANCHDFITDFPDGYDTVIGERGVKVSGDSVSGFRLRGQFWPIRVFWSSMKRPRAWIPRAKPEFRMGSGPCAPDEQPLSLPTACQPFAAPIRFWSSKMDKLWSAAPTPS